MSVEEVELPGDKTVKGADFRPVSSFIGLVDIQIVWHSLRFLGWVPH